MYRSLSIRVNEPYHNALTGVGGQLQESFHSVAQSLVCMLQFFQKSGTPSFQRYIFLLFDKKKIEYTKYVLHI